MITGDALLEILGKEASDPEVKAMRVELGLPEKAPRIPDGVSTDEEALGFGVTLFFRTAQHLRHVEGMSALPAKTPIVSDVLFSFKGLDDNPGFEGSLPHGLTFGESRAAVRERLGPPSWSSPHVANDRWDMGTRYVTIDFAKDGTRIRKVTCGLPWVI